MTVGEFIEKLSKFDKDIKINVRDCWEECPYPIKSAFVFEAPENYREYGYNQVPTLESDIIFEIDGELSRYEINNALLINGEDIVYGDYPIAINKGEVIIKFI